VLNGEAMSVRPEQHIYARWLAAGAWLGLGLLVCTFVYYLSGVGLPAVPIAELPRYWGLSAARFAAETGSPMGWGWLEFVLRPDTSNMVGVACMALVTPVCLLRLFLEYVSRREGAFAAFAFFELLVLAAAASGVLAR